MNKRVLFVVTSHDRKGDTGKPTGFYFSEVAHPWEVLSNAGYEIDFVSPKGGKAPIEGFDLSDPINRKFWEDFVCEHKVQNTMKPSEVKPHKYDAIFYAGGHGAMWDFPRNKELAAIAREIYENGGVVAAVCHGPAALINLTLSDGTYLIDGKHISAFTNEEEKAVKLDGVVPFLLEDALKEKGAEFQKTGNFQPLAIVHGRIVTGQNPQSSTKVGEGILEVLQQNQNKN
ncbi:MAG: type 1 glutamine amidotransferase domain-containing protein [Tannerellaceae bacterium]|nr:type 1 glutamine amidotransferase domain-containing protein [Tannerellaceae bacterium]